MSDHYYAETPAAAHDRRLIEETVRGITMRFATDAGVFSKQGIDYGSKLLIQKMDIPEDATVLDVGCGYGPIGLYAAALAKDGRVTMVDINERAVELAKENAKRNDMNNVVVLQSDLFEKLGNEKYTRILTNPPIRAGKEVVYGIFIQAMEHLVDGGQLWVVIRKKQGAPSAFAKLESLYRCVEEISKDKGYRIFKSIK